MSAHAPAAPDRERVISAGATPMGGRIRSVSLILAVLGLATFAYGAATGNSRAWHAFHFNWLFFTVASSAGVMFAAAQRITTARWSRGVVRLLDGMVSFLPFAWIGLVLMVLAGREHLYPWWNSLASLPHEKQVYLGHSFFTIRSIAVFTVIAILQLWYVWNAVRLDVGISPEAGSSWAAGLRARMRSAFGEERRELHSTHSIQGKITVWMAIIWGFGWIVLAWDQSMTLDPMFFSTMYGWQVFMGGWLVALMALSGLVRFWRNRLGAEDLITETHFHDIGKLCFAFVAFWGYITFAQYLVIWYGNVPEETHFIRQRLIGAWTPFTVAVGMLAFVVPFFGLLSVKAKLYSPTMLLFAACGALGIYLQRYIEVYPSVYGSVSNAPFGFWEIAVTLGFLGVWGFCYTAFMDAFPKFATLLLTSPYRDEVQVPVDPKTMEPLPAHE
ncbi:MAG: hypothetical protein IT356_08815 [Gemmatimonadaceae bacterium]|nr:hypothetical protein [Gemmatimonadaceae bacterium]